MIELTLRNINDLQFMKALGKLSSCTHLSPKDAYNVSKIWDVVMAETKKAKEMYVSLITKYGATDETGGVKKTETAPFFEFKEGVNKEDFVKEYEELLDIKVTLERNKLALSKLDKAQLSPVEISSIEVLLEVDN